MVLPVEDTSRACAKCGIFKNIGIVFGHDFVCGLECYYEFLNEKNVKITPRCDSCGELTAACLCDVEPYLPDVKPARPTAYLCPACCHFNGVMSDYYGPVICIGCGYNSKRIR